MTLIFRSKSFGGAPQAAAGTESSPPSSDGEEDEEEEEEENDEYLVNPTSSPSSFLDPSQEIRARADQEQQQFSVMAIVVSALRKSLVTCSVEREDMCSMDISWPTDVRHTAHVTFDRFNGFLGLPVEFQPEVPRRVPSASVSVFGVSPKSMQCSYDLRGNSVPTILLLMQKRLYSQGGLLLEGIFRINAENSQEEHVRNQLNKGIIPRGIDLHCLAGLIKAWFRELPTGILDSLTPEQVMHCNSEEECAQIVTVLPPMEAALLDWAINLMADVVQHEKHNKMNARNIAMVFAPNMTQMVDPLTALIHAVQVMNFLKTLILRTLREREELSVQSALLSSCLDSPSSKAEHSPSDSMAQISMVLNEEKSNACCSNNIALGKFLSVRDRAASDTEESFRSFRTKSDADEECELISDGKHGMGAMENGRRGGFSGSDVEGLFHRLRFKKGVRRLCRHPVFQLTKLVKKSASLGVVNSRGGGGEAWA